MNEQVRIHQNTKRSARLLLVFCFIDLIPVSFTVLLIYLEILKIRVKRLYISIKEIAAAPR